jgi:signal transduction histidine kinase
VEFANACSIKAHIHPEVDFGRPFVGRCRGGLMAFRLDFPGAVRERAKTPVTGEDVVVATDSQGSPSPAARPGRDHAALPHSSGLRRIVLPASIVLLGVATVGVGAALPGQTPQVITASAVALAVALVGVCWFFKGRSMSDAQSLAVMAVVALAGAALSGLLPGTPSFVIVCLALTAIGMRLPPAYAVGAGLALFPIADLALLAGRVSLASLASQDVAAAFAFGIGMFSRSGRISQQWSLAAQARAEELLTRLRASNAAQAQAAALSERARLAREIHDIVAHALSGLVLALDTAELLGRQGGADSDTLTPILEQVTRAQRMARDGLADTRRAVAALRGDELPGPALLGRLVADAVAATGIRAEFTVTGRRRPLPPEIGLALYRTAQEALTNTVKYAGRDASVQLRLGYRDQEVELAVEDTRSGDAGPPEPTGLTFGGFGLAGMRERAELLGGRLTAGPTETGFQVLLRLPADPQPPPAEPA